MTSELIWSTCPVASAPKALRYIFSCTSFWKGRVFHFLLILPCNITVWMHGSQLVSGIPQGRLSLQWQTGLCTQYWQGSHINLYSHRQHVVQYDYQNVGVRCPHNYLVTFKSSRIKSYHCWAQFFKKNSGSCLNNADRRALTKFFYQTCSGPIMWYTESSAHLSRSTFLIDGYSHVSKTISECFDTNDRIFFKTIRKGLHMLAVGSVVNTRKGSCHRSLLFSHHSRYQWFLLYFLVLGKLYFCHCVPL